METQRLTDGVAFTVRISKEVAAEVRRIAAERYEKPTTILRQLLRAGLDLQRKGGER